MQDTSTTLNQARSTGRIPSSSIELTGRVQADVAYGVADAILKAEDQEVNTTPSEQLSC